MASDWGEDVLRYKYDPLPEEPRGRKRAKRKPHVKSDHRHEYERVCVDARSFVSRGGERRRYYYIARRCKACGRIDDVEMGHTNLTEPPEGMPLYRVPGWDYFFRCKFLPSEMEVPDVGGR